MKAYDEDGLARRVDDVFVEAGPDSRENEVRPEPPGSTLPWMAAVLSATVTAAVIVVVLVLVTLLAV